MIKKLYTVHISYKKVFLLGEITHDVYEGQFMYACNEY